MRIMSVTLLVIAQFTLIPFLSVMASHTLKNTATAQQTVSYIGENVTVIHKS